MSPQLQQILSIYIPLLSPIATLAIVMVGFIYNNARMNDLRDLFRAELKAEIAELKSDTRARLDRLEAKVDKIGDTLSQMLADHEQRISRLEDSR